MGKRDMLNEIDAMIAGEKDTVRLKNLYKLRNSVKKAIV